MALEPTVVERIVEGVWLLRPEGRAPLWLWQWTDAPEGKEYEITYPGADGVEGHIEWFSRRAEALRSLGLPPTD